MSRRVLKWFLLIDHFLLSFLVWRDSNLDSNCKQNGLVTCIAYHVGIVDRLHFVRVKLPDHLIEQGMNLIEKYHDINGSAFRHQNRKGGNIAEENGGAFVQLRLDLFLVPQFLYYPSEKAKEKGSHVKLHPTCTILLKLKNLSTNLTRFDCVLAAEFYLGSISFKRSSTFFISTTRSCDRMSTFCSSDWACDCSRCIMSSTTLCSAKPMAVVHL